MSKKFLTLRHYFFKVDKDKTVMILRLLKSKRKNVLKMHKNFCSVTVY